MEIHPNLRQTSFYPPPRPTPPQKRRRRRKRQCAQCIGFTWFRLAAIQLMTCNGNVALSFLVFFFSGFFWSFTVYLLIITIPITAVHVPYFALLCIGFFVIAVYCLTWLTVLGKGKRLSHLVHAKLCLFMHKHCENEVWYVFFFFHFLNGKECWLGCWCILVITDVFQTFVCPLKIEWLLLSSDT